MDFIKGIYIVFAFLFCAVADEFHAFTPIAVKEPGNTVVQPTQYPKSSWWKLILVCIFLIFKLYIDVISQKNSNCLVLNQAIQVDFFY